MAADVTSLARALGLERYAVLGHSYGAFVVLQHAVDYPGDAAQTILSSGVPSAHFLEQIDQNLAAFEPVELREQVTSSWDREKHVRTQGSKITSGARLGRSTRRRCSGTSRPKSTAG